MSDYKKLGIMFIVGLPLIFFLLFISLFVSQETANESSEIVIATTLTVPFDNKTHYSISSPFGMRIHPVEHKLKFHSGIDLSTSCGTPVLASGNGIIEEVGYNDSLGNYVYIKHELNDETIYSIYGHLLDNSTIVEKGQVVMQGDKISSVGRTGVATGCHLHFTLMKNNLSWNQRDLVDPRFIVTRLR